MEKHTKARSANERVQQDAPEQPARPAKPAPRRKFILPTFAPPPTVTHIDYRTFLNDTGVQRF